MSEYLLKIIGVVFLFSVVCAIIPEGKTVGMVKAAIKLLCILVVLSPFVTILEKNGLSLENYFSQSVITIDESFIEYCSEKTISQVQKQIEKDVLDNLNLEVRVRLEWEYAAENEKEQNSPLAIKIKCIYLSAQTENKLEVQDYLMQRYDSKVVIEEWT